MMTLILFRLLGGLYPVLSGQIPSYHVVRRQGVSYSGHPGSVMWVVTGRIGGDGNSHSRQSRESLLVSLSILTASFYKHCCWPKPTDSRLLRSRCSCGSEEPLVLVFSFLGIAGLSLKGFMLAIDIASTYRFLCCTLDQWSLVKSATMSAGLQWLILALLILPRISCLHYKGLSLWHIPRLWYYPGHIGKCTCSHFY